MNSFVQSTMIARCSLQERTQDHRTGRWTPWQCCGALPALLATDGTHLCPRHFTQFWECTACRIIGQVASDITWNQDVDGGLCAACLADWEDPPAQRPELGKEPT
jgi:hypothetical protein